jgi:hypothetical protein
MEWPRLLAYITGRVDKELLVRNEYLAAENRILRAKIKGRLQLLDGEKRTLAEIAHRLGRKALAEVAGAAKPDTILLCAGFVSWWHASLMDRPAGNPSGGRGLRRRSRI